jgi:peptidoglycan hydrolase-like protein with peptidoglycan-binding domain
MTFRRFAIGVAACAAAATAIVGPSTPAFASTPQCTTNWGANGKLGGTIHLPTTASHVSICYLSYGDQSTAVTILQGALNECYGYSLTTDGQFGTHTRDALIAVQRIINANPDGGYGPETHGKMKFVDPGNGSGAGDDYCDYWKSDF